MSIMLIPAVNLLLNETVLSHFKSHFWRRLCFCKMQEDTVRKIKLLLLTLFIFSGPVSKALDEVASGDPAPFSVDAGEADAQKVRAKIAQSKFKGADLEVHHSFDKCTQLVPEGKNCGGWVEFKYRDKKTGKNWYLTFPVGFSSDVRKFNHEAEVRFRRQIALKPIGPTKIQDYFGTYQAKVASGSFFGGAHVIIGKNANEKVKINSLGLHAVSFGGRMAPFTMNIKTPEAAQMCEWVKDGLMVSQPERVCTEISYDAVKDLSVQPN